MLVLDGEGPKAAFKLIAEGQQIVLANEYKALMAADANTADLDARNVLAYLTGLLARRIGMKIEIGQGVPGRLEFLAVPAA
jgi:hypothetical protein